MVVTRHGPYELAISVVVTIRDGLPCLRPDFVGVRQR